MERIPEPELMDDQAQAEAYANADFEAPHSHFIELWRESFPGLTPQGRVLDLGCGPADITIRFAQAFPHCRLDGVDGAQAMLALGRERVRQLGLSHRVRLLQRQVPTRELPGAAYEAVISNSLLHHLHEPAGLWETVARFAGRGAPVFVMDLMRPHSRADAQALTARYAEGEPPILRRDLFNSLLAAFRPAEVREQLTQAGLGGLSVAAISDRHLLVWGYCGPTP